MNLVTLQVQIEFMYLLCHCARILIMLRIAGKTYDYNIVYEDFTGTDWTTVKTQIPPCISDMSSHGSNIFSCTSVITALDTGQTNVDCIEMNGTRTLFDKFCRYRSGRFISPFFHNNVLHVSMCINGNVHVYTVGDRCYSTTFNSWTVGQRHPLSMHNGIYLPAREDKLAPDDIGMLRVLPKAWTKYNMDCVVSRAIDPQVIYSHTLNILHIRDMRTDDCMSTDLCYEVGMQQVVDITPGGNVVILHIDYDAIKQQKYKMSIIDPRMFASYNIPTPSICDAHLGLPLFASA